MNKLSASGIQASRPDWHDEPLCLSRSEMEMPASFIDRFFNQYSLKDIRTYLDESLLDILINAPDQPAFYTLFYHDVKKIVEATHLLYERDYNPEPQQKNNEKDNSDDTIVQENKTLNPQFNKERYYLDALKRNPMKTLSGIFKSSRDDSLKFIIKQWLNLALDSENYNNYNDRKETSNLMVFVDNMQKLIEALYILCAAYSIDTKYDKLKLDRQYLFLNGAEQNDPYIVLKAFSKKFPFTHARAELWDLIHAIVDYKGDEKIKKFMLIEKFEQLLCMIKAAYVLDKDDALLEALKSLQIEKSK